MAGLFLWSFLPIILDLIHRWSYDPEYTHGFFIPPLAAFVGYSRRRSLPKPTGPAFLGLLVFIASAVLRTVGLVVHVKPVEQASMILAAAGAIWFIFGFRVFLWALPLFVLAALMVPLPYTIAVGQAGILQRITAKLAAFVLQVFGIPALAEGNLIETAKGTLDVAYACSGLQMLVAFLAVSFAVAMLVKADWYERIGIVLLCIPIAIGCNVLRIAATGFAYQYYDGPVVREFFHNFGGWVFIPLALLSLFLAVKTYDFVFPRKALV
jgi:exosortase